MQAVLVIVSVVGLVVSVGVAIFVAKKYGDVAGAKVILEAQAKNAERARVAAFQSLINEVARIRKLDEYYRDKFGTSQGTPTPRMPVAAFETAFVSGSPSLAASTELLDAVCDYLVRADSVNSIIDRWQALGRQVADVRHACNPRSEPSLSAILDRLDDKLKRELEEARCRLG